MNPSCWAALLLVPLQILLCIEPTAGQGCPVEVVRANLGLDVLSPTCASNPIDSRVIIVNIPADSVRVVDDAGASPLVLQMLLVVNTGQVFGPEPWTIGETFDFGRAGLSVPLGPFTLKFDDPSCTETITFDVGDPPCPFPVCSVVRPDRFSDLLDESVVAVTGPCSRDGTTTDVSIPAGAITITDLIADPDDTESSYVITQGNSIPLDSPTGWSFTDAIAVDLIPNAEATLTFTFAVGTFECQEQLPFTPQCGADLGRPSKRTTFRQLNMMGFEEDNGQGGEWRTCRSYAESELPPHKGQQDIGYDNFLPRLAPTPGAKWRLEMTENQDAEWLGLHHFDDRYEFGSEEADRRVKEVGYCRVHMPSVPRTGSTWFRAMFETATSQPSFSMWPEGGSFKKRYTAFSSDDPCGSSLHHMEGNLRSKKKFDCRDVRPPNATQPILYKSHTPFFPSYNKPSLLPEQTCMLVLLVRNPIDNHDAWQRYMVDKGPIMREYLPVWQGHLSHWIAAAGDIPIYVFRYEDMLLRAEDVLRRILETFPGGWNWSEESIAKAMRMFGPKKPFLQKCGAGLARASLAEVEMVRRHYGSYLKHLGYRFVKE